MMSAAECRDNLVSAQLLNSLNHRAYRFVRTAFTRREALVALSLFLGQMRYGPYRIVLRYGKFAVHYIYM